MQTLIDLTGQRFGRLTVMSEAERKNKHRMWNCKCDCGGYTKVYDGSLKRGLTTSCGCYRREQNKKRSITHGESNTRLYSIWYNMKKRCYHKGVAGYDDYGGRGITVCDEWKNSFETFREWALSNGYSDELTIDRINNEGKYEPNNCRWTTQIEQNYNTRISRRNTSGHKGVSYLNRDKKWQAYVSIEHRTISVGTYDTYEEAVAAREKAEIEYYGEHTQ